VAARREGHISHLDYFEPIWRTFWNYKFGAIKVEVDGEELYEGPGLVFVGNISHYAIGLHILRKADCSDGLLDVCVYKCSSKMQLAKHSLMTVLKQHTFGSNVVYRQGRNITVSSDNADIKTEIDGDPGPGLPVQIKVIPKAVNCIVPVDAKPAGIRIRIVRALG
jgi:diacylglycerol kinase family enzyme